MSRRSLVLLLLLLPLATGSAVIIALKDGSNSAQEGSLQEAGASPSTTASDLRSEPEAGSSDGGGDESQPTAHPAIGDDSESTSPEPQEQRPATGIHTESDDAFGAPMFASVAAETSNDLIASQPVLGSPSTDSALYRLAGRSRGTIYGGGMGGGGNSQGSAGSASDVASDSEATSPSSDEGDDTVANTPGPSSGAKSPSETVPDETGVGDRTEPSDETEPQDQADTSDSQLAWQPPEHSGPSENQPGETDKSDTPQQEQTSPQDSLPNDDSTVPDYPGYTFDPVEPTPVQVPEPSSLALLALGLLGCGIRRKRGAK